MFESIENVSVVADSFEISRSPNEFQHVVLGNSEAVKAFAEGQAECPIAMLKVNGEFLPSDFELLAKAKTFSRVNRLVLDHGQSDEAISALANDPNLSAIEVLSISAYDEKLSSKGMETLVNSANLHNVLELSFETSIENATDIVATSPLLARLVSIGTYGYTGASRIPEDNRLPLLRRIDESLSLSVFTDARVAKKWLAANPSPPLRARLEKFIERMYSPNDPRSFEQLANDVRNISSKYSTLEDSEEDLIGMEFTALLARAFHGQPAPVGTPFSRLSAEQQEALRIINEVGEEWWHVDTILKEPLWSYGFNMYEEEFGDYLEGKGTSR